jgi:polysaccharide export outer membrane protein
MEFNKMRAFIYLCFLGALTLTLPAFSFGQDTDSTSQRSSSTPAVTTVPISVPAGSESKESRYRIGFQDQLEIQVFRHSDLTQRVNVNANGTINLFRLPTPIVAVCKTEEELANDVATAYRKDYLKNPEVKVLAVEQRSRAFGMIGAVDKPGQYMISRRVRLIELLAQAGGPSKEAGTRVMVARTGSTSNCKLNDAPAPEGDDIPVYSFRLSDILEGKDGMIMRPGDIASVLKADVVFVYGNVNKQGRVEIKEPLTLTQAIATAEGLKAATDKNNIKVLRQKSGSTEREELTYDLDDIIKRKVADPFLEPNDVVAVNTDKTKEIFNSIGRSLTQGLPGLFYKVP